MRRRPPTWLRMHWTASTGCSRPPTVATRQQLDRARERRQRRAADARVDPRRRRRRDVGAARRGRPRDRGRRRHRGRRFDRAELYSGYVRGLRDRTEEPHGRVVVRSRSPRRRRGDRHGYEVEWRRARHLGRCWCRRPGVRVPARARVAAGGRDLDHPGGDPRGVDDAGGRWHRLDGGDGGQGRSCGTRSRSRSSPRSCHSCSASALGRATSSTRCCPSSTTCRTAPRSARSVRCR